MDPRIPAAVERRLLMNFCGWRLRAGRWVRDDQVLEESFVDGLDEETFTAYVQGWRESRPEKGGTMQRRREQWAAAAPKERLRVKFQVKSTPLADGHFRGMASVFGSTIQTWIPTIMHKGAFAQTLIEDRDQIKLLWQHQMDEPIGVPVELVETDVGLEITGKLSMTQRGRDALILLRDQVIDSLSIGFDPIVEEVQRLQDGTVIRHLKQVKLYEVSLVTWAADSQALIGEVASRSARGRRDYGRVAALALAEAELALSGSGTGAAFPRYASDQARRDALIDAELLAKYFGARPDQRPAPSRMARALAAHQARELALYQAQTAVLNSAENRTHWRMASWG